MAGDAGTLERGDALRRAARRSGSLLLLVAGTFDAEPFYVTGAALVLLGAGSAVWIAAGAWGADVTATLDASQRDGG